jgi:hypothetical protein
MKLRYRKEMAGEFNASAPNGIKVHEVLVLQQAWEDEHGEHWFDVPVVSDEENER